MERLKITCLLLLVSGVLIGCNRFQASGQEEKSPQNTASVEIVQKNSKSPDEVLVLFKGENMTVVRWDQLRNPQRAALLRAVLVTKAGQIK